jgi:hypothetical protein
VTPGEIALDAAVTEWFRQTYDPANTDTSPTAAQSKHVICQYINEGLGWALKEYKGNTTFAWCGAFAAWCWLQAGMTPARAKKFSGPDVPGDPFASTYRLMRAAQRDPAFQVKVGGSVGGDVVIVKSASRPLKFGNHITMALAWAQDRSFVTCVHGNGHGRWPDGSWVEGVVISTFPVTAIAAIYRPHGVWLDG